MHIQQILNENENQLMIQRCQQGIKLVKPDQLNPFKKSIAMNDLFNVPFHVYFSDAYSVIQKISESTRNSYDILSLTDVNGKTVEHVMEKNAADYCIWHDQTVVDSNSVIIKDQVCTRFDGISYPILTIKFPWLDIDNTLLGIFGCSIIVDKKWGVSLADSMSLLAQAGLLQAESMQNKRLPGLAFGDLYFTEREKEIIAQLIRGKSAREIAAILSRSKRTIEHHIENMKLKTNSGSKSDLIEKIIDKLL